ncbi:MAG TPA: hypothetical protein VGH13_24045 [Xanthobacteraceae bacterium]
MPKPIAGSKAFRGRSTKPPRAASISAPTRDEIAISILAEVVAVRRGKDRHAALLRLTAHKASVGAPPPTTPNARPE